MSFRKQETIQESILESQTSSTLSKNKRQEATLNVLNNIFVKFIIHHVQIYKKHLKDFNEEKKLLKYFSFYNLFDIYETKVKMRV